MRGRLEAGRTRPVGAIIGGGRLAVLAGALPSPVMSAAGWVFQIGIRVVDVGLLVFFLVWMFRRMRDEEDDPEDDGPGGGGSDPRPHESPGGGGGSVLPTGRARPGRRKRDHGRPTPLPRQRGAERVPRPLPARVRRPQRPVPVRRSRR